jgi:hypothetical protein
MRSRFVRPLILKSPLCVLLVYGHAREPNPAAGISPINGGLADLFDNGFSI